MFKRLLVLVTAFILLTGSIVFPLGDLSLTRDLPEMYFNYSKITTVDELGVIDFIGDYLLHGKDLFGHNKNDKQSDTDNVQFQHQPVPFQLVLATVLPPGLIVPLSVDAPIPFGITKNTSDFKDKLFRPPLG